jgi:hypothetical protein
MKELYFPAEHKVHPFPDGVIEEPAGQGLHIPRPIFISPAELLQLEQIVLVFVEHSEKTYCEKKLGLHLVHCEQMVSVVEVHLEDMYESAEQLEHGLNTASLILSQVLEMYCCPDIGIEHCCILPPLQK